MSKEAEIEKDIVVQYKGVKFFLARHSNEVFYSLYLDDSEPLTYELMTEQKGDLFVDVGANIGGYTLRLASSFREVLSIEPNPRAADLLSKNIDLNHFSNVRIFHDAISDTIGEASMSVPSSGKTTRSSIVMEYDQGSSFGVRTSTLDAFLEGYDKIDLIKIDAEGAEVKVLEGAEKTLRKTEKIVLETGPWSENQIKEILMKYEFEFVDLDKKAEEGKNILAFRPN
jgi:FkbM family methyltransferase